MTKFDLMNEMPELDIPTLNYIWDMLWRKNACNLRKNAKQRTLFYEYERLLRELEALAEDKNQLTK